MFTFICWKTVQDLFPHILLHAFPPLYQPHRELLSPEQSNSLLQFGIYFAQ